MILFKKANDLGKYLEHQREKGAETGFVPTMGALHEGHHSLVRTSLQKGLLTVSSIFVNPTQFNDPADFQKYPVTIEKDILALEQNGCDILFLPGVEEIYPRGLKMESPYDLGYIETILEGKFRPGHFQGVCQVVQRLLGIVQPDHLFLGQKDYQQCMVIRKLIEMTGMDERVQVTICPTLREPDGLAMSSRNMRLSHSQRSLAPLLYRCLVYIKDHLQPGDLAEPVREAGKRLVKEGFRTDYVVIADAVTLEPVASWDGRQKLVALVAAYLDGIRLIDNLILN